MSTVTARKAPRAKSTTPKTADPILNAIAITALLKSQKADKHRELLAPGVHECALTVLGTVDKKHWHTDIRGTLVIAPDAEGGGSTPYTDLLHSALCSLTENQRRAWLGEVAEGRIPVPDCSAEKAQAVAAELEPATAGYRHAHRETKRGNVTFTPVVAG